MFKEILTSLMTQCDYTIFSSHACPELRIHHLTLVRADGGVYDIRNFEQV
jgi:hypothetical protein